MSLVEAHFRGISCRRQGAYAGCPRRLLAVFVAILS